MLIKCPECELQVSDKAYSCPHCGYPLKEQPAIKNTKPSKRKHRRLPNGFGQISKIKNQNLAKPYRAMITIGKSENGKPICKLLKPEAYFESYNDAYAALVKYNKGPYELLSADVTFQDVFDLWYEDYCEEVSEKTAKNDKFLLNYIPAICSTKFSDLRPYNLKSSINDAYRVEKTGEIIIASPRTQSRIKTLYNSVFDYAVENGITDTNQARNFKISSKITKKSNEVQKPHMRFTDEEFEKIKENVGVVPYTDVLYFQCYTGWRPQELGLILLENVDFEYDEIIGGIKTDAGEHRIVPIHPNIKSLVADHYERSKALGSKYLFSNIKRPGFEMLYSDYHAGFTSVISELGLNPEHSPHDGRVQFVSMAKDSGVDEYAIKRIVGHKIGDITESTYTKRPRNWLYDEVVKIP